MWFPLSPFSIGFRRKIFFFFFAIKVIVVNPSRCGVMWFPGILIGFVSTDCVTG